MPSQRQEALNIYPCEVKTVFPYRNYHFCQQFNQLLDASLYPKMKLFFPSYVVLFL